MMENVEPRYTSIEAALSDLVQMSRMLEFARGCEAQLAQAHADVNGLIDKLAKDRKVALVAIDALTETAPRTMGVEIAPQVERTGEAMRVEVAKLLADAAAIVDAVGGL